jgi:hypothetical protein
MWRNFIGDHIRRTNRNLLITNIIVLLGAALWLIPIIVILFNMGILIFDVFGWLSLIALLTIVSITIWNFHKVVIRSKDFGLHPIASSLKRWGSNLELTVSAIEEAVPQAILKTKSIIIIPPWILLINIFGLDIVHADEVVWAYIRVTAYVRNFIPTGESCSLVLRIGQFQNIRNFDIKSPRRGKNFQADIKAKILETGCQESDISTIIETVQRVASPLLLGYEKERENEWNKNSLGMCKVVQWRKSVV